MTSFVSRHPSSLAVAAVVVAGGAALAPSIIGAGTAPSPGTLGNNAPVSAVTTQGERTELPPALASRLGQIDELVTASARRAAHTPAGTLYIFDSSVSGRFCIAAAGASGSLSVSCSSTAAASTGKYGVMLPTALGRPTPYVFFGVVPDGVAAVRTDAGDETKIVNNVFAITKADGAPLGRLTYRRGDGTEVSVNPLSVE